MPALTEYFGQAVFNEEAMRQWLPEEAFAAYQRIVEEGQGPDSALAEAMANAMKDWALAHGATHFTHWFQPMTGVTAEKHDAFLAPLDGGAVMAEFSAKELIKGEPDASSFPSGGLRATFEARGYTAWDPTSYAFIKDGCLCIPSVFCAYSGEVLDEKTPLLRSMDFVEEQALRVLRLCGDTEAKRVIANLGPEQEYFLVDRALFEQRPDLRFAGRTLFGARPPKGQEMDDHYFGAMRPRVTAFMKELDEELWKLGVYARTEHNEAAPAQHELAPVFGTANVATDHNQLTMEVMKKVAERHGMVCLLHEKPFEGVNGSGKHNNWSLSTDSGKNIFKPGKKPAENKVFLLFLAAVIRAVDEYQEMLRITAASAGNDHRLGANEAPPAIVSMFLGDELTDILEAMEHGTAYVPYERVTMETGAHALPTFRKDTTDRNRTSPLAFTGNKFEFRMPGAAMSVASANTVLNTAVGEVLASFAEELEKTDGQEAIDSLIAKTYAAHKRIVFNGNSYTEEWKQEAARRGLANLTTTAQAVPHMLDEKNLLLFGRHGILTPAEMHSRCEILLENYCKVLNIEALTMVDMARQMIFPAVERYQTELCQGVLKRRQAGLPEAKAPALLADRLGNLADELWQGIERLEKALAESVSIADLSERALFFDKRVVSAMKDLRAAGDELEKITDHAYWPLPTYAQLLYSV
ncbi:MAG: glutamine synthetase III [Clostridia bacterium]|nr:glutamine synthetase III [Clostridia bacterium]